MTAMVVPTGGAVLLSFPGYYFPNDIPGMTISRGLSASGAWTLIYDGPLEGAFVDVGDGLPAPLSPTTAYWWQATDQTGSTVVGPLTPAGSLLNNPDQLTQILIRSLQGAIDTWVFPPGMQKVQVMTQMPMNGWTAMPFIVVNLDLIQQTETEIGEDVVNPTNDNNWTLFANAKRCWRITIMSTNAGERDFYRDRLLIIFRVLKATAFNQMGLDVSHTFSAHSYTDVKEWEGAIPGFYAADLMLEIDGVFPAAVMTHYPVILEVAADPTFTPYEFVEEIPDAR